MRDLISIVPHQHVAMVPEEHTTRHEPTAP
jgi:hypothetical protein